MARVLADQPNVDSSDLGNYPNSRVKNTVGANPGTDWTEEVTGDFIQFFQKLLIDAGITANGNPDNVANGYQLIDALVDKMTRNGVKRQSSTTLVNSTINTTELDLVTFTFDAVNDWDDLHISFSCATGNTPGTGTSIHRFRIYVDGVEVHNIAINQDHDLDNDTPVSLQIGGIAYTANTIVKVTAQVTGGTPNDFTVGSASLNVDAINV